jgi:catalase
MDSKKAVQLAGEDPDYHVKDLFNAIEKGDYPTWTVCIQVMKPEEVKTAPIDIFDCTYTWPYEKYPLRRIGRLTLNKNVCYFPCSSHCRDIMHTKFMNPAEQLLPGY